MNQDKTVIFIGGTGNSGTSIFNLMLSNDPKGFSCGEFSPLFKFPKENIPSRNRKNNSSHDDHFWQKVLESNPENVFERIFELKPEINFIVDSSKDFFWIKKQGDHLAKKGFKVRNLLIWKTLEERAQSLKKRKMLHILRRSWVNYHRFYFRLVDNFSSVKYFDLIADPKNALKRICAYSGIPYFEEKHLYWKRKNKPYRIASPAAQVSLFDNTSEFYHKIVYEPVEDSKVKSYAEALRRKNSYISKIENVLESKNICKEKNPTLNYELQKISFSLPAVYLKFALEKMEVIKNSYSKFWVSLNHGKEKE